MNCQSCGILIMKGEEFGTYGKGVKNLNYCRYCFDNGAFLEPDLTVEQMAEKLSKPLTLNNRMSPEDAKQRALEQIKNLKRWKKE